MSNKNTGLGKRTAPPSRFTGMLTPERVIIGGSVLGTLVILLVIILAVSNNSAAVNIEIEGVERFVIAAATHVTTPVTYPHTPPAGGSHYPIWQTCGVYAEPIVNEHAVHSLEHGVVWITYQPDLPHDQLEQLERITTQGSHRLLSPYPGIDSPIILTAWGYQLRLESASDSRLMDFIRKYEQGPTTPEKGATCSGGETRTQRQLTQG